MKNWLSICVLVLLSAMATSHEHAQPSGIEISEAWARPSAPSAPSAGYMSVNNPTELEDVLLSVSGDFAKRLELHKTVNEDGVMRMLHQQKGIVISAGQTVHFKPGGYHLMFMGLPKPFVEGEIYHVTLEFKNAGNVTLALPVRAMKKAPTHEHSHSMDGHPH